MEKISGTVRTQPELKRLMTDRLYRSVATVMLSLVDMAELVYFLGQRGGLEQHCHCIFSALPIQLADPVTLLTGAAVWSVPSRPNDPTEWRPQR